MKVSEIKQNYDDETVHTFEQVGYIIRHLKSNPLFIK